MAPSIRSVRPVCHALDGVLLLDKPSGLSSQNALARAKRLMCAAKAGHTGTLDPLASGLLPLCFGNATKFTQDLLDATKCYEATLALGAITTTGDTQGKIVNLHPVRCNLDDIRAVLARFRGNLMQTPPMYSALKRDGKPLYAYARRGITLDRPARPITIKTLELLDAQLRTSAEPSALRIHVVCSKGTYIRALAQDIGNALGCGAHLSALRRIGIGRFNVADAVPLEALEQADYAARTAHLRPLDTLLLAYPAARLDARLSERFKRGQRLRLPDHFQFENAPISTMPNASADGVMPRVRVYDEMERLLGAGRFIRGVLEPQRLIHFHL